MATQTVLNFEIAEPTVKTLNDMVLLLLKDHRWWAPFELCDEIWRTRQMRISDSSCTARLRDLRKGEYGSHGISIRKRQGTRYFEYRLEDN